MGEQVDKLKDEGNSEDKCHIGSDDALYCYNENDEFKDVTPQGKPRY